ncbi:MAG TPA: DUF979 domain-containing protein [Kofleriaceae bacterium]|nr:DUF979 domain-containing protein [Kofleriaceae bacterium]
MLTITHIFYLIGVLLVGSAVINALERRWTVAAFWAIVAIPFVAGDQILAAAKAGTRWPAQAMGLGVVAIAVLASLHRGSAPLDQSDPATREASAARLRNRLFVPALAIPILTGALVLDARYLHSIATRWIEPTQLTLISLGVAATLALIMALVLTRGRPVHGLTEGRRLLDSIGWAAVLPLTLATLGGVFTQTHVGDAIARIVGALISTDSRAACLLAYGLGMVMFTAIMGNAFAAFPVMTAGIGLPLLVKIHGASPAVLGSMGMLTGYCGTLLTPMAANFNIVPAVLLELRDRHGVIRAQVPTAIALLIVNLILMSVLVFR